MAKRLEGQDGRHHARHRRDWLTTARLFVAEGAFVFIADRRQMELDEAVKAMGTNVSGVQGDVAQLADLDRLYQNQMETEIDGCPIV